MDSILAIGFLFFVLAIWFWTIIDITRSRFINPTMRTIWLIAVLLFPVLGSILYQLLKNKFINKEPRKFQLRRS
ncbi:MAG: PLD nuclease N-terminal domain-containing protein [Vicingaceae bacterium]|nr:PLD nuclease N-terminal domain-containing protein [Vicingaceae bacterium]